jgi:hypothetical protein
MRSSIGIFKSSCICGSSNVHGRSNSPHHHVTTFTSAHAPHDSVFALLVLWLSSCSFAPDSVSWDDSEDVACFNFLSKEEEYVNSVDEEDGNCPVYIDREGNIINVGSSCKQTSQHSSSSSSSSEHAGSSPRLAAGDAWQSN